MFEQLQEQPVVYVTRDIERALGLPLSLHGYHIITNSTPLAKELADKHDNVFLVDQDTSLSTRELLAEKGVVKYINKLPKAQILVFKNTKQIERICKKNKWPLLNPSAQMSSEVEGKISQVDWLGPLAHYLPKHNVRLCRDVEWRGEQFILQYNHGHSGLGTILIDSPERLTELQETFPKRPARCSDFIPGPIFTNNNVVTPHETLVGNISYQITGLAPFTDNPFATIGTDWAITHTLLNEQQLAVYHDMVAQIGNRFREHGWKGCFGVDVVLDNRSGELFLLEINARQPASTSFESILQMKVREQGVSGITVAEAHLAALLDIDILGKELIPIKEGAQLIQRITKYKRKLEQPYLQNIKAHGFHIIPLDNTKLGERIAIIQSTKGIIAPNRTLNEAGKILL